MLALFDAMCYINQVKRAPAKEPLIKSGLYNSRLIGCFLAGARAREAGFLFSLVRNLNPVGLGSISRLLSSDKKKREKAVTKPRLYALSSD